MYSHLYIHVPFCRSKCDYCAFYSETSRALTAAYLDKLKQDLSLSSAGLQNLQSVYIGGGTPTFLAMLELEKLFDLISCYTSLAPNAEISIESNPETLNSSNISLLQERITRLSMGVQSFDPLLRQELGRKTSQEAIEKALLLINQAKFKHFNCDLIYGIPGQNKRSFFADISRAGECGVDHLSCYSLTLEPGTPLSLRQISNNEELEAEEFEKLENILAPYGLSRYEISNYSKPTSRCFHNFEIWGGATYLGLGPGAASFNGVDRFCQVANLNQWLKSEAPEFDHITVLARLMEIVIMRLRTTNGWSKTDFERLNLLNGIEFSWADLLAKAQNVAILYPGCIDISQDMFFLNRNGLLIWNSIAEEFLI